MSDTPEGPKENDDLSNKGNRLFGLRPSLCGGIPAYRRVLSRGTDHPYNP